MAFEKSKKWKMIWAYLWVSAGILTVLLIPMSLAFDGMSVPPLNRVTAADKEVWAYKVLPESIRQAVYPALKRVMHVYVFALIVYVVLIWYLKPYTRLEMRGMKLKDYFHPK